MGRAAREDRPGQAFSGKVLPDRGSNLGRQTIGSSFPSRTWTFTIRDGVKFHDGTDLTAEDVAWSLQHFLGPQALEYSKSTTSVFYAVVMDRIEQTGPDQVSVTTREPLFGLPGDTAQGSGGYSGGIVYPQRATQRATLRNLDEEKAYDANPVGAGVIKFVKHTPLQQMTFERFEDFYHQPVNGFPEDHRLNFTELDLRLVPEESTRIAALRAGEADLGRISLGARQQVEPGGGKLVYGPEARAFQIELQGCREPHPCQDQRVRQALAYGLDRELMRDRLFGGPDVMQVKGWWVVTPSTQGYSPELDPYPYDPEMARQLLAADSWRELGIDVEVRLIDKTADSREMATQPEVRDGQIN